MPEENQLYVLIVKIKATLQKKEWKYYHLQSAENFIYHLKSFKSERTRKRMATEIEMYLNLVKEKMKESSGVHNKSKELFPII